MGQQEDPTSPTKVDTSNSPRRFTAGDHCAWKTTDEGWVSYKIKVPKEYIGYLVSIFEAYENHFLVRTEIKEMGVLRIWFPADHEPLLKEIFLEMRTEVWIEVLEKAEGMTGLDEVFPQ